VLTLYSFIPIRRELIHHHPLLHCSLPLPYFSLQIPSQIPIKTCRKFTVAFDGRIRPPCFSQRSLAVMTLPSMLCKLRGKEKVLKMVNFACNKAMDGAHLSTTIISCPY
jgi:hypothetical protein